MIYFFFLAVFDFVLGEGDCADFAFAAGLRFGGEIFTALFLVFPLAEAFTAAGVPLPDIAS